MILRFLLFVTCASLFSCKHFIRSESSIDIPHFENSSKDTYQNLRVNYKSQYDSFPDKDHARVDMWVRYFTGKGRPLMRNYLERSSRYLPLMKSVMREYGLPEDLVYVALIESGFSFKAYSRANAVGYWQFIQGTGRRYGLKIGDFVDERRDPVLSTRAAAEYFKDLYSLFGSWPLALASYNAGEYRVNRVILKHYNRDFWYLVKRRSLPRETRNYVPKLIAAIRIAKNPSKYGFHDLNFQDPIQYNTIPVKSSLSLKKLAKGMDIPYKELQALNPMYKGEYVPVYHKNTILRVPVKNTSRAIASLKQSQMKEPRFAYHNHYWYKVRRGDSLSRIAHRHKTTVYRLRKTNRMGKNRTIIRVGQRLKIPSRRLVASRLKSKNLSKRTLASKKQSSSSNRIVHIVKRGDTLTGISKRYRVNLSQLTRVNSLTIKSILLTGTRLVIPH